MSGGNGWQRQRNTSRGRWRGENRRPSHNCRDETQILRRRATMVRYTCGCLLPYYSSSAPGIQLLSGLVSFQCIFMVKDTSRSKPLAHLVSVAAASVYLFDSGLSYFPRSLPYLQSCWGAQHQNFHKPSLSFAPTLL